MRANTARAISTLALAGVTAASGWLLAGCADTPPVVRMASHAGNDTPRIESQQLAAFSILRRTAPNGLAPSLQRRMEATVEPGHFGLMYEFAQRTSTNTGADAWVVPGSGFICVMRAPKVVAGCNSTSETIRRGMSVVAIDPPSRPHGPKRYFLLGIAPDGVKAVAIKGEDGSHAVVPVINNVYSYGASTMVYATLRH